MTAGARFEVARALLRPSQIEKLYTSLIRPPKPEGIYDTLIEPKQSKTDKKLTTLLHGALLL